MSARRRIARAGVAAALLALGLAVPAAAPAQDPDPAPPADAPSWELLLHRGRLGMEVQRLTPELRRHLGAPADRGVLVARVEAGRPAEEGGVEVGDVIVAAGGEPVADPADLLRAVATVPEGETLALAVVRGGDARTLQVAPEGTALPDAERLGEWLEEGLREGSRELRQQLEELQRRLEEFERRLREPPPDAPRRT
ncbi:MAG: PDZ domain-containing protein [Myxococcota bacterium]|nr:PDZ domain-containing protein [Myxococcota bacterium]